MSLWRTLCDTLPDLHGSLPPDALLSIKHIESTEWLPYSSPEGVCGQSGWGVGVPNTALCFAKPSANTHMSNRTEQKPPGCCFYCSVNSAVVNSFSIEFRYNNCGQTKGFKVNVELGQLWGGHRRGVGGVEPSQFKF